MRESDCNSSSNNESGKGKKRSQQQQKRVDKKLNQQKLGYVCAHDNFCPVQDQYDFYGDHL